MAARLPRRFDGPVSPTVAPGLHLPSALDVGGLVTRAVAEAVDGVHEAALARGLLRERPPVVLDGARLTTSMQSERHFRLDGVTPSAWAPLSGFWQTTDGWVRTHGNYPHHADRLRRLLGLRGDAGPYEVAEAAAGRDALELEDAAASLGAVLAAVRTPAEWRAHEQGVAVAGEPLLRTRPAGEASPRPWDDGDRPLAGVRVLDLTRVIAGPVATRDLALAGADVLRVDSPRLPEVEWFHLDTGQGKRSTVLDLADGRDGAALEELLGRADVLVTGYRPGSLDRHGLAPDAVAERHPGLVTASVSAWGTTGPWRDRRGFDSIVQAASGIAVTEAGPLGKPGALPAQALDHSAGHLLAGAVARALVRQRTDGGSWHVETSLARVAHELLATPGGPGDSGGAPAEPTLQTGRSDAGEMTVALPVLSFAGAPETYPELSRPWGRDPARWWDAAARSG